MPLTLTVSGGTILWDGPDTSYNVYGVAGASSYTYASNISAHSTKIWSPDTPNMNADVTRLIVSSTDLTVSGSVVYSLGRLTYSDSTITGFTGTNIIIPEKQNNIVITSFGTVFIESAIQSVVFDPSSQISSIDDSAFYGCTSLTSITIPQSVTRIFENAFQECTSLTSLTFESNSKCAIIGDNAFRGAALTNIIFPQALTALTPGILAITSFQSVSFQPNSLLNSIGFQLFNNYTSIQSIIIPRSVISIGSSAFNGCTSLSGVVFESNSQCTTIGVIAFAGTALTSITIPRSVNIIESAAFQSCAFLSSVVFETDSSCATIGVNAFFGCTSLLSIVFPRALTALTQGISAGSSFQSVSFQPNSLLNSIGDQCFIASTSIQSIIIPQSVTSIGSSAFQTCTSLSSVVFDTSSKCETIGIQAFAGCSSLLSIVIPRSVTSIGSSAFDGCTSLNNLVFESNSQCTTIGYYCFYLSTALQSIIIPRSVTSIGSSAFYRCTSLSGVVFESNSLCETIGDTAFAETALTSITIPIHVANIGSDVFNNCSVLTRIIFEGIQPTNIYPITNITEIIGFYYYRYEPAWSQTDPSYQYDIIPMYAIPDNLSLNGAILSWEGPVDILYNIYVDGILYDLSGVSGLSVNIASQLRYGRIFSVTAVDGEESPLSRSATYNDTITIAPPPSQRTFYPTNAERTDAAKFQCCSPTTRFSSYDSKNRTKRLQIEQNCCPVSNESSIGPMNLSKIQQTYYMSDTDISINILWDKTPNATSDTLVIDPSYIVITYNDNPVLNDVTITNIPSLFSLASFQFTATNGKKSIHQTIANILFSHACFLAGAIVRLANGETKKIEDIQVGDIVLGAFGEHNVVLARQFPLLGTSKMCKINGEHDTSDHHPHISTDKKFYTCDTAVIEENVYGKSHYVVDSSGNIVLMTLHGLKKGRVQQLTTGIELQTVSGGKKVETLELYSIDPNTELYNLVVGGSHTYTVNGYAVTGWPREDDFDYDTWKPIV